MPTALTLYFVDQASPGSSTSGSLQDGGTAPGVSVTTTGFAIDNTIATSNYTNQQYAHTKAANTFGATVLPGTTPGAAVFWSTTSTYSGTFATGNWTIALALSASASFSGTVNARVRVFISTDPTFQTGLTELTAAGHSLSTAVWASASGQKNTTVTFSITGATLTNHYIGIAVALENDATATGSANVFIVQDGTNSVITTATFTEAKRSVAESISTPTDSVTRAFTGSRAIAESVSISDAVARAGTFARAISEPSFTGFTFYLLDQQASGSTHGSLQDGGSAPGTSTTGTGWTVNTTITTPPEYAKMAYGSTRAATNFTTTAQPGGGGPQQFGQGGSCWRTQNVYTGTFATGNWTFAFAVSAQSTITTSGKLRLRVWRSSDPTGLTSVTQITSAVVQLSSVSWSSSSGQQNGTATTSITGATLTNEYIFIELALEVDSTPSGSTSILFVQDAVNSVVTTPAFVGAFSIFDTVSRTYGANKTISESVSMSDAVVRSFVGARNLSESVSVADAVARAFTGGRSLADSVTQPSDAVARAGVFGRAITEPSYTALTLYLLDQAAPGSSEGSLQLGGVAPGVSVTGTGWTVGTTSGSPAEYSNMVYGVVRPASTFGTAVLPTGNGTTNCWRSQGQLVGTMAAGSWTFSFSLIATGATVDGTVNVNFRMARTSQPTGTSPNNILTNQVTSSVSNLTTSTAQTVSVTVSVPQTTFAGEYLFMSIALEISAASSSASAGVLFVQDGAHSLVTTPGFVGMSVTPFDQVSRGFVGGRSVPESIAALSDAVARAFVGSRSLSETVSQPTDAVARAFAGARALAESIATVTDAVSRRVVGARAVPESVSTPSDAVARAFAGVRSLAESIATPADAVARMFVGSRGLTEALATVTDAVSRRFTGSRAVSESVSTPSDAVARVRSAARALAESVATASDVVTRVRAAGRAVAESVPGASDAVSRAYEGARAVAEAIGDPSDAVTRLVTNARNLAEGITTPSDAIARAVVAARSVAEVIPSPADAVARAFAGARAIADSIPTPSDSVAVSFPHLIAEAISTPSDAVVRAFAGARALAESLPLPADVVARAGTGARQVAEAVATPADAVARVWGHARALTEAISTPSDVVSRAATAARLVSEAIVHPVDSVARAFVGLRHLFEQIITPTDSVSRARFVFINPARTTPFAIEAQVTAFDARARTQPRTIEAASTTVVPFARTTPLALQAVTTAA